MRRLLFGLTLISALLPAKGVQLKAPFGDGMVLQRDRKVPVCGLGVEPGGTVRVNFSGQTKTCVADTNGQWQPAYIGNFENIHHGTITNDYLNVFSPKVAAPKALRYLYNPPGAGRLYGPTGLPVGCFEIKAN